MHAKGLVSKGTLWSTSAVLDEKYHGLIIDTHLAYIEAGAEVITTTNFSSRRIRMEQNRVNNLFEFANQKLAEQAFIKKLWIPWKIRGFHENFVESMKTSWIP